MTVEELIEELQRIPNKRVPALIVQLVYEGEYEPPDRVRREIDTVRGVGHGAVIEGKDA